MDANRLTNPGGEGQGKDKKIFINPDFSDLLKPETFINHFRELEKKATETTPHEEILSNLLDQIEPLNFTALAFPETKELWEKLEAEPHGNPKAEELRRQLERYKLTTKHYLILSIEHLLKFAEKNRWGLCKNQDFIYLFNGAYWKWIDKAAFEKFLGEAAEKMGVTRFSARYYQFREQLLKQFLSVAYLPAPESKTDKVLINLLNGTFEITTSGTNLRPFDRSDFLTYQLPFEYDPKAKAPLFEKFINRVLPDVESQRVLAEYLGYVFIKNGNKEFKLEKALVLYGTGANGKSVIYDVVTALFGSDNVSSFSLHSITDENGYFRAKLINKLVNYVSEMSGNLESSILKQLISGEPVGARNPYGEAFNMTQYAKLIFNSNGLPKDVEHTHAFFRRFLIIPFDVTIPEEEQDKALAAKIIEKELPGVFNWVLQGLHRLLEQKKFSECAAAQRALEQYKYESNSVLMYLDENGFKKGLTVKKYIKEFYQEYRAFCLESGMPPFKKLNFIKQLKAMGFIVNKVSQNKLAVFIDVDESSDPQAPF